jgi:regulation of enolase protein 1 (concanavalin A-like superfamily)
MQTFCSHCGSALASTINFCPNCGTPTASYYANAGSSQLDPTVPASGADNRQQKVSTDYGSPPYGVPDQSPYDQFNPYIPLPPPPPGHRRSGLMVGIISGIVVAILILGAVGTFTVFTLRGGNSLTGARSATPTVPGATSSQAVSQSCGSVFSDEFNATLDSRWNWINPNGSATYNLATKGFLSISTPPDSDLNSGRNFNAPRLLQPISGNFTIETVVTLSSTAFFQSAGLLVWQDQATFLRFELGYTDRNGIVFQKGENGLFSGDLAPFDHHLTPGRPIALRVQRQGDHFTVAWHEPGQAWQIDGETDLHFTHLMVGLDLLATYNAPQTTASYDYFRVSCT